MLLTDEEIIDLFPDQDNGDGDIQYGRAIEAAVLAKLREQEPVGEVVSNHQVGMYDEFPIGTLLYANPAPIPEGWQPIETAPKVGCHLAFDSRPHTHPYVIVWLDAEHPDADEAGWHEHWSFDPVEPTHWMPLPNKHPMAASRSEE